MADHPTEHSSSASSLSITPAEPLVEQEDSKPVKKPKPVQSDNS